MTPARFHEPRLQADHRDRAQDANSGCTANVWRNVQPDHKPNDATEDGQASRRVHASASCNDEQPEKECAYHLSDPVKAVRQCAQQNDEAGAEGGQKPAEISTHILTDIAKLSAELAHFSAEVGERRPRISSDLLQHGDAGFHISHSSAPRFQFANPLLGPLMRRSQSIQLANQGRQRAIDPDANRGQDFHIVPERRIVGNQLVDLATKKRKGHFWLACHRSDPMLCAGNHAQQDNEASRQCCELADVQSHQKLEVVGNPRVHSVKPRLNPKQCRLGRASYLLQHRNSARNVVSHDRGSFSVLVRGWRGFGPPLAPSYLAANPAARE